MEVCTRAVSKDEQCMRRGRPDQTAGDALLVWCDGDRALDAGCHGSHVRRDAEDCRDGFSINVGPDAAIRSCFMFWFQAGIKDSE